MVWTDSNHLFNDAFFLMIDAQKRTDLFPIWKTFSFRNHPIDQLLLAQTKLNDTLNLKPDFAKAYFLKAVVQRNLNSIEESILYLHEAKERDYYLFACNIYLAEYYIYKLKFEEALRYLEEVNAVFAFNPRVNLLLALVHMELFQFQEAKRYLNHLGQISDQKKIIDLLHRNLSITEAIVNNTSNRLVLKNFKLKNFNYNLQLKTNLINYSKQYMEFGINYDMIACFIHGLILKHITAYPNYESWNEYNVNTILNYLSVEENQIKLVLDGINFEAHFVKSYEEYQEVEQLMKEDV